LKLLIFFDNKIRTDCRMVSAFMISKLAISIELYFSKDFVLQLILLV